MKSKEAEEIRTLFANGKMKPLLKHLAREMVRAGEVLHGSNDLNQILKAQERRRTLREIALLGKESRSFFRRVSRRSAP